MRGWREGDGGLAGVTMRRLAEYTMTAVLIVLIFAAIAAALLPHLGWRIDTVVSGSMEPQIPVGSVLVTRPVADGEVGIGDIVTFLSPAGEHFISHRVIAVEGYREVRFRTKGDANDGADPFTVSADAVAGKVWFHVPYAGYFCSFVKTPLGFILAIIMPGLALIALELKAIWIANHE